DSFTNPAAFNSTGGGTFQVRAPAHTYTEEGTYTISLSVGHEQSPGTNLVANPGFETGNFTGWTQGGNTAATTVSGPAPHSGNDAANLGPVGSDGTLSQNVTTVVGQSYIFSFWLQNDGGATQDFSASVNGNTVLSLGNSTNFRYTLFNFLFTATT